MTILALTCIAVVLLLVDWQTRFIAKHPEQFFEINIILGKHPSLGAVNLYFALCIAAVVILGQVLPEIVAMVGGGFLIALEVFITIRNHKRGIGIS